jgi:hypothetical protein
VPIHPLLSTPRTHRGLRLRALLRVVVLSGLSATSAGAGEPAQPICSPLDLSTVPPCLAVSPNGSVAYTVTIVCPGGPVRGALVEVRFTAVGDTLTCWCFDEPGPRPHVFSQSTNSLGVAEFHIRGGGCVEAHDPATPGLEDFVAEIFADGVKTAELGLVSPDIVDAMGRRAVDTPNGWDPAGTCGSGLADAVAFTPSIAASQYDWCADINCDDAVTISDAVTLTPFLSGSISCSGDAGP